MNYKEKYLKYKIKYLNLQKLIGGFSGKKLTVDLDFDPDERPEPEYEVNKHDWLAAKFTRERGFADYQSIEGTGTEKGTEKGTEQGKGRRKETLTRKEQQIRQLEQRVQRQRNTFDIKDWETIKEPISESEKKILGCIVKYGEEPNTECEKNLPGNSSFKIKENQKNVMQTIMEKEKEKKGFLIFYNAAMASGKTTLAIAIGSYLKKTQKRQLSGNQHNTLIYCCNIDFVRIQVAKKCYHANIPFAIGSMDNNQNYKLHYDPHFNTNKDNCIIIIASPEVTALLLKEEAITQHEDDEVELLLNKKNDNLPTTTTTTIAPTATTRPIPRISYSDILQIYKNIDEYIYKWNNLVPDRPNLIEFILQNLSSNKLLSQHQQEKILLNYSDRYPNQINKNDILKVISARQPATATTTATTTTTTTTQLIRTGKYWLFLDEPTVGADNQFSPNLKSNMEVFYYMPQCTILASATMPLPEKIPKIIEYYEDKFKTIELDLQITKEISIGCDVRTFDNNMFMPYSGCINKKELKTCIQRLQEVPSVGRMLTYLVAEKLWTDMRNSGNSDLIKFTDEINFYKHFSDINNLNANEIYNFCIKLLNKLLSISISINSDDIIKKVCSSTTATSEQKSSEDIKLIKFDTKNTESEFFMNSGTSKAAQYLGMNHIISIYPLGDVLTYFGDLLQELTKIDIDITKFENYAKKFPDNLQINTISHYEKYNKDNPINEQTKPKLRAVYDPNTMSDLLKLKGTGHSILSLTDEEDKDNSLIKDNYNKLLFLLLCGIGVYDPDNIIDEKYTGIVVKLANEGKLSYLFSNGSFDVKNDNLAREILTHAYNDTYTATKFLKNIGTTQASKFPDMNLIVTNNYNFVARKIFTNLYNDVIENILEITKNKDFDRTDLKKLNEFILAYIFKYYKESLKKDKVKPELHIQNKFQINTRSHYENYNKQPQDFKNFRSLIDLDKYPMADLAINSFFVVLLCCGVGIYAPNKFSKIYNTTVLNLAESGKLAFLISDESIAYGVNLQNLSRVFIMPDFASEHSLNTLFQVMGRAGRPGLSSKAEIFIDNTVANKLKKFMANINDPDGDKEAQNMNTTFTKLIAQKTNEKSIISSKNIKIKGYIKYLESEHEKDEKKKCSLEKKIYDTIRRAKTPIK